MKIKTIIIDDEPLAIEVIAEYCNTMDQIEVIGKFSNPVEALAFLSKSDIDLLFLDIEMPLLNGIEFLEATFKKPIIIFTTAYPQYAIDGYNFDAVDYLLKPIPYKRFLKAINKVVDKLSVHPTENVEENLTHSTKKSTFIFIKSDYENLKINIEEIKYIEGLKDYLKIHLTNNKYVLTLSNFQNMLEKIANENFIRVHNSFVVNIESIKSIQKNRIIIEDKRIPISETYKKAFFDKIKL